MLRSVELKNLNEKDATQAVKAVGFDDEVSSEATRAILRWHFGGSIKLCLVNQDEATGRTLPKLNEEGYQAQSRSATEDRMNGTFRLPHGPLKVLFITGMAWGGLPKPNRRGRMRGFWQTVIAVFLKGEAEGGLFGEKSKPPILRVVTDQLSGVYIDGSPITCASFAERVHHPQGRQFIHDLAGDLTDLAQTNGLSTEDLDVRQLTPDHLVECCFSTVHFSHESY